MGCFLACFGISNKRKRRRFSNRVAAAGGDHRRGSYVPLDSALTIVGLDGPKESPKSTGFEQLREKTKEGTSFKIRKKVSFNLDVQTYEPVSTDYQYVESEEEEEQDKNREEVSKGSLSASAAKRASSALRAIGLYPSNHRYQNVRDSYDSYEEDDYAAEDENSEFDDDDYYGDDDYCDGESDMDDQRLSQEGFPKQIFSSSINGEMESCRWNLNAGDNIPLTHSVLSPIENLSQWKAAKAKAAAPKHQKENISPFEEPRILNNRSGCNQSKHLLQEIPVHASLSSWIRSK